MKKSVVKNRVMANTFFQVMGRVLVILASLLTTSLLTRFLGISGYGDYIFVTSFIMLFVGLSDLGTTVIGVREASTQESRAAKIFNTVLSLRLIVTFFLLLIVNVLSYFLPQFFGLRLVALTASLVLPCLVLRTTVQAVFQINFRLDLSAFLEIISSIFLVIMLAFFYFTFKTISLVQIMSFWTLSALVSGVLGLFISFKYLNWKIAFDFSEAKKILKEALPLGLYLLAFSVYDRGIDSFLIKTYVDSQALGYYGLAYKIHGNLILGSAFLMNSLFPLISSLRNEQLKLKIVLEKTYTILFLAGLLFLIFGYVLSPLIIGLIAGTGFNPSVVILRILLFATFFSYLNHFAGYSLIALGEQKKLLFFSIIGLLVNLFFNLMFIPKYSYFAAAAATIITEGTLYFLSINYLIKKYRFKYQGLDLYKNIKEMLRLKQKYFDF